MHSDHLAKLSDEELMSLYQNDNFDAFKVLYSRHKNRVYTYLSNKIFEETIRDEIHQAIFLKLHQSRKQYSSQYLFLKWLYTIARTSIIDHVRKRKIDSTQFFEEFHHIEQEENPQANTFEIDLSNLSAREAEIVNLRYISEYEFSEISKKLSLSTSNIRKILSRAIKKLRANTLKK